VLATLAATRGGPWAQGLYEPRPLPFLALEAGVLVWLSPEARGLWQWEGRSKSEVPGCLSAQASLESVMRALKRSALWDRLRPYLTSGEVVDQWRDGRWHFLTFGRHFWQQWRRGCRCGTYPPWGVSNACGVGRRPYRTGRDTSGGVATSIEANSRLAMQGRAPSGRGDRYADT
jgi:hypothetical protein